MRVVSKVLARELNSDVEPDGFCCDIIIQGYRQGASDLIGREIRRDV